MGYYSVFILMHFVMEMFAFMFSLDAFCDENVLLNCLQCYYYYFYILYILYIYIMLGYPCFALVHF